MNQQGEPSNKHKLLTFKAYSAVFQSEDGKAVLHDLINVTGLLGPSLDMKDPNPYLSAYRDGAKSVLHRIMFQMNTDPEQYIKLLNNHQEIENEMGFNE